jgi:hypothetical protein
MDRETKIFLGRILGEIYSLRRRVVEDQRASPETIYGLFHGVESTIDQEIERTGFISRQLEHDLIDVLHKISVDEKKLGDFKGYYDIERELEAKGIARWHAIVLLSMFKLQGRFTEMVEKIENASPGSPIELHHLGVDESEL